VSHFSLRTNSALPQALLNMKNFLKVIGIILCFFFMVGFGICGAVTIVSSLEINSPGGVLLIASFGAIALAMSILFYFSMSAIIKTMHCENDQSDTNDE
jgi:heme/copper-type cytochrome/quinol oxidase subunit 1